MFRYEIQTWKQEGTITKRREGGHGRREINNNKVRLRTVEIECEKRNGKAFLKWVPLLCKI